MGFVASAIRSETPLCLESKEVHGKQKGSEVSSEGRLIGMQADGWIKTGAEKKSETQAVRNYRYVTPSRMMSWLLHRQSTSDVLDQRH